ncbi:MAG: hypothetical protein MJE77_21190 [Proteobacteria bacterium]|nr:hypothetical protein [Pseudomonadota bacterium]
MAIIGIDVGTQSLKVVVTGDDLTVLGEGSGRYSVRYPEPGWAEQDVRDWQSVLAPAVAQALAAAGLQAADVRAVGVSGQLDGCVGVDSDGKPTTPCIIWCDRRADSEMPAWSNGLGVGEFMRRTGVVADATHMAAKIRWLKRHADAAARYHQPVSYLVEQLTGAYVFDHGLASTTMLYALDTRDFDSELLDMFEIDRAELPAIAHASDRAGTLSDTGAALTGLRPGTPVAVGTGDDFATPLGAGLVSPGRMACVLGTGEVVGALSHDAVFDPGGLVETHCYANDDFFIENPGWLSGGAMSWLREIVGVGDFDALDAAASSVPPGSDDLLFLPALSGAMAPEWIPTARGCFYGLTTAHGRGHLARAVMEGCAFAMLDVVERLIALDVSVQSILLMGGGARSRLWAEIRSYVTGLPVERVRRVDTCPVGAAMLAAVAAGISNDLEQCAELVANEPDCRDVLAGEPEPYAIYRESYQRYQLLFEQLRPLY